MMKKTIVAFLHREGEETEKDVKHKELTNRNELKES